MKKETTTLLSPPSYQLASFSSSPGRTSWPYKWEDSKEQEEELQKKEELQDSRDNNSNDVTESYHSRESS